LAAVAKRDAKIQRSKRYFDMGCPAGICRAAVIYHLYVTSKSAPALLNYPKIFDEVWSYLSAKGDKLKPK
jgi:hypothetical protein